MFLFLFIFWSTVSPDKNFWDFLLFCFWLWALSSDIGAGPVWCTLLFGNLKDRRHLHCKKSICFLQCYVCATWLCEAEACPKQQCYSDWVAPIVMTRAQSAKKIKKSKILISCRICPKIKRNRNTIQKHEYDAFHFVWEDGFRGMHFVLQMPKRA